MRDRQTSIAIGIGVVLSLSMAGYLVREPWPSPSAALAEHPGPDQLDSLSVYLRQIDESVIMPGVATAGFGEMPDLDDREAREWEIESFEASPPPAARRADGASGERGSRWTVSAILIAENRRVAIINDTTVGPGDTLPGGVRVKQIDADRVLVEDAAGKIIVLRF